MEEKKTRILFEKTDSEMMNTEVTGKLVDIIEVLLTGITSMFDDDFERLLFKKGIELVYKHWDEEGGE